MDRLGKLLERRRIILGDGAMGTMLHQAGLTIGAKSGAVVYWLAMSHFS